MNQISLKKNLVRKKTLLALSFENNKILIWYVNLYKIFRGIIYDRGFGFKIEIKFWGSSSQDESNDV